LNSGDNIAFNLALNDGYIYSKSVRGASEDFKKWILDEVGYRENSKTTKIKSRVSPDAEILVSVEQIGKKTTKKKMKIEQKQIAFYSEKYAKRAKHKRDEIIEKAVKMIANPAKYQRSCDYGAAGYIKNINIDKETGEIKNVQDSLFLDIEKIKEEEKYDGYYAIVTSELDDSDEHTMEIYKGLWRIEETFKISKSVLNSRPIYLQTKEHINAHFLTCFISLLIARAIEIRLDRKFSISRITDSLKKATCSRVQQNIWHFHHRDEVTELINNVFGLDFGQKFLSYEKIINNFSVSKI
jgi:tRNA U54 and U55 pseudouridine synthase Pus10